MKKVAQKIFHQIKAGCNKDLCLNMNCKTNAFAIESLARLENDKMIFKEAIGLLKANKSDPDNILCAECTPIRADNIDSLTERQLDEVFEDFYQFSCSFVDKKARELTKKPIA